MRRAGVSPSALKPPERVTSQRPSLHLKLSALCGSICEQSASDPLETLSWCLRLCAAFGTQRTSAARSWLARRDLVSAALLRDQEWRRLSEELAELDPFWLELGSPPELDNEATSLLFSTLSEMMNSLSIEWIGLIYEELLADRSLSLHRSTHAVVTQGGDFSKVLGDRRRSSGAHYTPPSLCREVITEAARRLHDHLADQSESAKFSALSSLSICDPAMGCGAFVMEAISWLSDELAGCSSLEERTRLAIAARCVYGVDVDPLAVEITRFRIRELTEGAVEPSLTIKSGDSLIGEGWSANDDSAERYQQSAPQTAQKTTPSREQFSWRKQFPRVARAGGFDLIIGNPPFLGGRQCAAVMGNDYIARLHRAYPKSKKSADLCAFFFRRSADLCAPHGAVGFIATNTIAQGATRESGLAYLVDRGCQIFSAWRRRQWPSEAAVKVSIIYLTPSAVCMPRRLNGREVDHISSLLEANHIEDVPPKISANRGGCAQGSIVLGMGFTFDEVNQRAAPLAERQRLLDLDPSHDQVIKPYMGGRELNTDPLHRPHRYTIDFEERSLEEATRWPELLEGLRERVSESRLQHRNPKIRAYPWWQHWNTRAALYKRLRSKERVLLTNAQAAAHLCFAFVPTGTVFANSLNILPDADMSTFALLQSRIHEQWAWLFSSTLGDQIRYNPTDCYETFPFPSLSETQRLHLRDLGEAYHESRAMIMSDQALRDQELDGSPTEGLTATYNRFHDPQCHAVAIQRLRRLRAALDQAALEAYGWGDLSLKYAWVDHYTQIQSPTVPDQARGEECLWRYTLTPALRDELIRRLYALAVLRSGGGEKL